MRALPLLLAVALSGCTYVCHRYLAEQPLGAGSGWRVYGSVTRWRGPSNPHPGRHSWPHWGAAPDDEYRLTLLPVPDDSTLWERITAEAANPVVAGRGCERRLTWARVVDARVDSLSPGTVEVYARYRRASAPIEFVSEVFHLPVPPPDSLLIEVELRVRDADTGALLQRLPVRAWAVKDRHRRWGLQDMAES